VLQWKRIFKFDLDKPEGMKRKFIDTSKQKLWGWNPKVSLIYGISKTYKYHLVHGISRRTNQGKFLAKQ
tara:strand:- start:51 stop:257 length:207 start_codon:yes stop_codon:yes gene_type:complete